MNTLVGIVLISMFILLIMSSIKEMYIKREQRLNYLKWKEELEEKNFQKLTKGE